MNVNLEFALEIIAPLISLVIWMWSRLDKRFDKIDKTLENMSKDIVDIKVQIGKLETRVEERTLRVHYPKTGTNQEENGG